MHVGTAYQNFSKANKLHYQKHFELLEPRIFILLAFSTKISYDYRGKRLSTNFVLADFLLINKKFEALMATGIIKWFNEIKGFGFIALDGGQEDIFVHQTELREPVTNGAKVNFEVGDSPKGARALNVTLSDA